MISTFRKLLAESKAVHLDITSWYDIISLRHSSMAYANNWVIIQFHLPSTHIIRKCNEP